MNWLNPLKQFRTPSVLLAATALLSIGAQAALGPGGTTASASDYEMSPPQVVAGSDPFLMINLSVELTQQAEAFTGANQVLPNGTVCGGRDGGGRDVCYSSKEVYIGYFDPDKCYVYNIVAAGNTLINQRPEGPYRATDITFNPHYFTPDGPTDSNHECNYASGVKNQFSGNFLNWSTMTALDQFRSAMTGGARIYDDLVGNGSVTAKTLLARAYRFDDGSTYVWPFVDKRIEQAGVTVNGATFINDPARLTPWNVSTLYVVNNFNGVGGVDSGHKTRFYDGSWTRLTYSAKSVTVNEFNVIVEVCKDAATREANCVEYTSGVTTWYKPEGLLQKNAQKMRYAMTSYSSQKGNTINGGVLRSNAKYIGTIAPTLVGGYQPNPVAETDARGLVVDDPEGIVGTAGFGYAVNSGIINYINQFALASGYYKENDPAAELYYEGLRYIMGLNPTSSFSSPLSSTDKDGFPVYNQNVGSVSTAAWIDPITTANSCQANYALYVGDQFAHRDNYLPGTATGPLSCGSACSDFQYNDPTILSNPPTKILVEADTWTNTVGAKEGLGNIGNSARSGRGDGFWIAGLAYWANISDVRPDIPGVQSVKTFIVDTQEYANNPPMRQQNQLWLAAKYGGFDDINGDNDPNDKVPANRDTANVEWTSDTGANPDPDAYTLASQPTNLVAGLNNVFNKVLATSASASAAAVVSNSSQGIGALYEAIYEPRNVINGELITWTGTVRGLWLDDQGRVREDSTQDGILTNADYVVNYITDPVTGYVTVDLEDPLTGNPISGKTGISVKQLTGIWDAREELTKISNAAIIVNRSWTTELASDKRYVFTWIDYDLDGVVDSGEQQPFIAGATGTGMADYSTASTAGTVQEARLLGIDGSVAATNSAGRTLATDLVNYIRGLDKAGWRNRSYTSSGGGGTVTYRLGDIVHSAPLIVGEPSSGYDITYTDSSYNYFKQQYANRRQVIYTGANDGMLHAFNAGFFNPRQNRFDLKSCGTCSEQAHPLGSEIWSYVPYNLLPHLQWLTDPNYPHSYFVDGAPQAFDVNIFPSDATHPYGWGTILVVGFRFGGGDITVDVDSDADGNNEVTMRSSYVIMDITDPEQPPVLLAEINTTDMGFTTAKPTVIKRRVDINGTFTSPSSDDWYLVMGSGPWGSGAGMRTAQITGTSTQEARLFVYNLNTLQMHSSSPVMTGEQNGFIGGIIAKDWDNNYDDDTVYFGTVATVTAGLPPVTSPTGSLYRMSMGTSFTPGSPVDIFNGSVNQPFSAPPYAARDIYGTPWIYGGSGRFFVDSDITLAAQMSYYGVKEDTSNTGGIDPTKTVSKSGNLENTTGVQVFTNGNINPAGTISSSTFSGLINEVKAKEGWYFNFPNTYTRHVDRTIQVLQSLIFTDYETSGNSCSPLGSSSLWAINMLTGTGSPFAPFGTDPNNTNLVNNAVDMGPGQSFLSGVVIGPGGTPMIRTSQSTLKHSGQSFALPGTVGARMSWRELPIKN